jgi:hypothetical protein
MTGEEKEYFRHERKGRLTGREILFILLEVLMLVSFCIILTFISSLLFAPLMVYILDFWCANGIALLCS